MLVVYSAPSDLLLDVVRLTNVLTYLLTRLDLRDLIPRRQQPSRFALEAHVVNAQRSLHWPLSPAVEVCCCCCCCCPDDDVTTKALLGGVVAVFITVIVVVVVVVVIVVVARPRHRRRFHCESSTVLYQQHLCICTLMPTNLHSPVYMNLFYLFTCTATGAPAAMALLATDRLSLSNIWFSLTVWVMVVSESSQSK